MRLYSAAISACKPLYILQRFFFSHFQSRPNPPFPFSALFRRRRPKSVHLIHFICRNCSPSSADPIAVDSAELHRRNRRKYQGIVAAVWSLPPPPPLHSGQHQVRRKMVVLPSGFSHCVIIANLSMNIVVSADCLLKM